MKDRTMLYSLPENTPRVAGIKLSAWMADPDGGHCSMRIIEGTDPSEVANRVAFIEKTPRVRIKAFDPNQDWKGWHQAWKGDDGWDAVAQGWCDAHLQAMGYDVPDAMPYDDSMV